MANELTNLIQKINSAIRSDKNMRIALSTTLATHKGRIFEKGQDANSDKIGSYSANPISIARKNQARQTGKTYFKGGYAEYKSAIGKNQGFVNFRNTDQMMMDYGLVGSNGKFGFGFQNPVNNDKSIWLEDKFEKRVFDLTNQEENILADTLVAVIKRSI